MSLAFRDYYFERLEYYLRQKPYFMSSAEYEIQTAVQYTSRVANSCEKYGKPDLAKEINDKLEAFYREYLSVTQLSRGLQ